MKRDPAEESSRAVGRGGCSDLEKKMECSIVGQPSAVHAIVSCAEMFHSGLAPAGRPAGVFLLMGPTGTGKTRTVEALAEALHGSEKKLVRIDCGEFQMEHEVARLIGAPPGYLGHRETQPMITQKQLQGSTSEQSSLSIVLFDEIEKAASSLSRLLLGVLDKAALHLGDNSVVNFEESVIFLTSNVGASEMFRELRPGFGYGVAADREPGKLRRKLENIGLNALRKRFSPEFVNRIDSVITYEPLSRQSLKQILDMQLAEFQQLIDERLGERAFRVEISESFFDRLLEEGTSPEYGARELKRTVHRMVIQPVAAKVVRGELPPGCCAQITLGDDPRDVSIKALPERRRLQGARLRSKPVAA